MDETEKPQEPPAQPSSTGIARDEDAFPSRKEPSYGLRIFIAFVLVFIVGILFAWHFAQGIPVEETSSISLVLPQSQPEVWSKLRDVQQYPEWRPGLRAVMPQLQDSDGVHQWNEVWSRRVVLHKMIVSLVPDSLAEEWVTENKTEHAIWEFHLEPVPLDSTRVTLNVSRSVAAPFQRLVEHFSHRDKSDASQFMEALNGALEK
ncbi:MAG TPA: hypothetical protein VLM37_09595 [Fibrobacteraceae bacterium]|nr:hypothetical protein [Fibrobacteraceae bacterium]